MNVFRSRKKSVAEADAERPSFEKAPPLPSTRGRTIFRRKQQPEQKKELDLAMVLPPTDDFRTSLLMPNLSARFSMLREQDDPSTKIGKANDDSVLFPKRTSKMDLFGHGLSDIAEVSSISGSIRPPFANERHQSFSSDNDYGTDDDGAHGGSIMSRAKPGQGNKFFGGRQKVYKIPQDGAGSTRDLNVGAQDRPAGKPVYEDDISMSVFQALRAKEKAERKISEENGDYFEDRDDRSSKEHERDPKRTTSSSTNSNLREGRISTAATSVASQLGNKHSPVTTPGQERVGQKKRLYGHGLDQQIHDQQSSAMNRLNSIHQRTPAFPRSGSTGPSLSRSASNLNDKFRSSSPFSPVLHSGSPSPVTGFGGFDFGVNHGQARSSSRDADAVRQTPPMSPNTGSPVDPKLVAALEPNDFGKATASGAFNKPKMPYNEQQFAQRQLQLQEGRNTPPLRSMSRAESASDQSTRLRNGSFASVQSGQSSRLQHAESSRAPSNASLHRPMGLPRDASQAGNEAFLADFSGSEFESSPNSPDQPARQSSSQEFPDQRFAFRKPSGEHRRLPMPIDSRPQVKSFMDPTVGTPVSSPGGFYERSDTVSSETPLTNGNVDSPALGQDGKPVTANLGAGLNDLIRGHLRSDSGASSVYPSSPTMPPPGFLQAYNDVDDGEPTVQQNMSEHARQVLERASQLTKGGSSKAHDVLGGVRDDKVQQILGVEAPRQSNESGRGAWQDQFKISHARGGSTETQKEREDFSNELAERRRAVQDNLMRMEEASRSGSPGRTAESSPVKNGPLGLLKKASRTSLTGNADNPTKAMKMLGMTAPPGARGPPIDGVRNDNTDENARARAQSHSADGRMKAAPGSGLTFRERSIGAERRERFFRKGQPPQAQAFEQSRGQAPLPPGNYGFARPNTTSAEQPMSYHPAGRARKYSPPNTKPPNAPGPVPVHPPTVRSKSSPDRPSQGPRAPPQPTSYFPPQTPSSPNTGFTTTILDSSRATGMSQGYSANATPPIEHPPHVLPTTNPAIAAAQANGGNRSRSRSVSKYEISGPTFLSGGASVSTIDLPAGASLQNGMWEHRTQAPPLPPINPNRRRGRIELTQNVFTAFGGKSPVSGVHSQPSSAHADSAYSPYEEYSTFSGEEDEPKQPKQRTRLRKISSEGGSIAAKARHQALMREAGTAPGSPRHAPQITGRTSRKNSESRAY